MKTFFKLCGAWIAAALLLAAPAYAQDTLVGGAGGYTVAVVGGFTTLNPADKSAKITLSVSDTTATKITDNSFVSVRSLSSASSGLYYAEAQKTNAGGTDEAFGVANASMTLADFVGDTADGIGSAASGSVIYSNGSQVGTTDGGWNSQNAGMDIALDVTHRKVWFRRRGGTLWNNDVIGNQNPATNTGGIALPTNLQSGAVFFAASVFSSSAPDVIVVTFKSTDWVDMPPSGFGSLP